MSITDERDLRGLQRVGAIVGRTLRAMSAQLRAGMTTAELDAIGARLLRDEGARSAPVVEYGFPGATCISVNQQVVHGVPGPQTIEAGDIVTIDVTAECDGYVADAAVTVPVRPVSPTAQALCDCADRALRAGLAAARAGRPITDIGRAVARSVQTAGFTIVPQLTGHGVGRRIHEPPTIPNYADPRIRGRLTDRLVITIEPIVVAGWPNIVDGADGWTVSTADGSLAAHAEHTVVIMKGRPLILTA